MTSWCGHAWPGAILAWTCLVAILPAVVATKHSALLEASTRCSACHAVSTELRRMVEHEKGGHDLEVGARLDSRGNYMNVKKINYETSELRVLEILDTVCDNMEDYVVVESRDGQGKWMKSANNDGPLNIEGTVKLGGDESEQQQKHLYAVCHSTLEEYEDEIATAIRSNAWKENVEVFDSLLCSQLTMHCQEAEKLMRKQNAKAKKTKTAEKSEDNAKDEL